MYCSNCGLLNSKDSKYCGGCGKELIDSNVTKNSGNQETSLVLGIICLTKKPYSLGDISLY